HKQHCKQAKHFGVSQRLSNRSKVCCDFALSPTKNGQKALLLCSRTFAAVILERNCRASKYFDHEVKLAAGTGVFAAPVDFCRRLRGQMRYRPGLSPMQ